ncbi:hypothetical protein [Pedobacter sp. GSP4]|uniref:hypothetical protein n=1 Tax=Pedobacter sp. GSP4 TaxID=3453716 RepID=UPI003F704E28
MKGLSPWALTAMNEFAAATQLHRKNIGETTFTIIKTVSAIWITVTEGSAEPIHFSPCPVETRGIRGLKTRTAENSLHIHISSLIGEIEISISFGEDAFRFLTYTCSLRPKADLFIPYCPRDILTAQFLKDSQKSWGDLHLSQKGTRSGIAYFTRVKSKLRVLYLQNLTALSSYAEQTGTSLSGVVSGQLPEIGLSLPPATEKPLKKGQQYIISEAYICLKTLTNENSDLSLDYLDMLSAAYLLMPRPETRYLPWPEILKKGLKDLIENHGCWSMLQGNNYLNAYVSDYDTPPEIMVQLAVLLPLIDYMEWSGEKLDITSTIRQGLPSFYSKKLKTILRWHPAAEDKLTGEEEQKMPMVMDSWYLHHPLLNLSRMALKGDKDARKLFFDSIGYAINVARKFAYQWPVFYKMDTLEIIKAETAEGEGGEQDVPGLYALVMLQAYELSGDKKYLAEAEKAARKLSGIGMNIMYQANNTAFAAGGLLRLYKITGKELYLTLSYRCLASIFQNVQLWDCNYGFGKHIPTFFALFPLADAPYTAAYEEQEVFCALHDYLKHAEGIAILPSLRLLCTEFIRYLVERAPYYYPPMLPREMVSTEVKTGELDPDLWIAIEDIQDGNSPSGTVGQEVYGAGNAFGILPRHFIRTDDQDFLIFCDYPMTAVRHGKQQVSFRLQGDLRMQCRLRIVPAEENKRLNGVTFTIHADQVALKVHQGKKGELEGELAGNAKVLISWKA